MKSYGKAFDIADVERVAFLRIVGAIFGRIDVEVIIIRRSELGTTSLQLSSARPRPRGWRTTWPPIAGRAGAMRAWSSRPRISMRGLSSRSCRCDWSRNWRSAPISSATPIGSSARFSSPPEEPMPLCYRSDGCATPSRQLQVLLADGYRAIAYRQAPDRSGRELDAVIDGLIANGSKQARGFADQLRTAARILGHRRQSWAPRC